MTTIEELWNKAKKDPAQRAVNGSLAAESKTYCSRCRSTVTIAEKQTCVACLYIPEDSNGN